METKINNAIASAYSYVEDYGNMGEAINDAANLFSDNYAEYMIIYNALEAYFRAIA